MNGWNCSAASSSQSEPESELQPAARAGGLAVGRPRRQPAATRSCGPQRALVRRRKEQGGERDQRAAGHHPQARPAAQHDHGVTAESVQALLKLEQEQPGVAEAAESGQSGDPAADAVAPDQLPQPGDHHHGARGCEHAPVRAVDAGEADEAGERRRPRQQAAGDDRAAAEDGGQADGGPPAAQGCGPRSELPVRRGPPRPAISTAGADVCVMTRTPLPLCLNPPVERLILAVPRLADGQDQAASTAPAT